MRCLSRWLASTLALGLGLLALPSPVVAGPVSWSDEAGDANGFDPLPPPAPTVAGSSPRPSDEGLDLLAASVASDGQALVFTAQTAVDAIPPGASGTTMRFLFTYDDIAYQLIGQRTAPDFTTVITSGLFFRAREPSSPELACRECTIRYEAKTATVQVRVLVSSLASGVRAHSASSPKLAPGATFTNLAVLAQRNLAPLARNVDVGRTVTVDTASAGDLTLTV